SGIRKKFTDPAGRVFEALRGIDLEIGKGECFSLLGPSGCGKSTLLRILSGLEQPDEGKVVIGGEDMTRLPPEKRPTAMVFQSYALFPHLTVEGNVAFGLKIEKKSAKEIRAKVDQILELVQLSGLNNRKMDELSGGQQQRVALARVLAIEPSIILMDEPLSNLDAALRRSTRSMIQNIASRHTLVYVTHDQEEALMMSDRVALMMDGQIMQVGTPMELYNWPASQDVARFIGQRNMVEAYVAGTDDKEFKIGIWRGNPDLWIRTKRAGRSCDLREGQDVIFALKGDDFIIEQISDSNSEGWIGNVRRISFAGMTYELAVKLQHTRQFLRICVPTAEMDALHLRRGDSVRIRVRDGAGILYSSAGVTL
ncbi:ABC transporter ATP-binding protein, partial [Candidatus Sumerlaeota bacterium]|nr:ABC transporter ATP-binding protein [Candidatus Sumerlaeota bacterium]